MTLTINGKPTTIPDGSSLASTVSSLCRYPQLVIAELNGAITEQTAWASTTLKADDRLELISFVGGG